MVITSPFSSIKGYIVSKPPLVLFTLCLMGFAVTTFTFAYYVEHNESLPNLDAHRDLVSFLNHLSRRTLCISTTTDQIFVKPESAAHNASESEEQTTIYVSAKIKPSFLQNITFVEGFIPMSDWVSECTSAAVEKINIAFAVPQANHSDANVENKVCVAITGPKFILESAVSNEHCPVPFNSPAILGHIIYKSLNDIPTACSDGKSLTQTAKLTYIPSSHNSVLLTHHDRSVINLHLFHTSYFLLVMAITLICYAMIKGKPVTKHQSMEKIPLDV